MEKFRVLKKQVDASSSRTQPEPGVAPILSTAKRVLELSKEADEAGIRVERIAGDSLTVPKGEKGLTVGADYGAELLNVQLGKRVIRFNVVERGNPMSTKELVACLFSSDDNNVTLRGPHVLISADDVAIANLRLLAVLRQSVTSNLIRKKQVELLLEELSKTYR